MVGSAGNELTNLALSERSDDTSPDYPPDTARERLVTDNCLDLPAEGPNVLTVSAQLADLRPYVRWSFRLVVRERGRPATKVVGAKIGRAHV